jgi:acyl dehydratase
LHAAHGGAGNPDIRSTITNKWTPDAAEITDRAHLFTWKFNDLEPGETLCSDSRTTTLEDIETFAHGYLRLSFAAGLVLCSLSQGQGQANASAGQPCPP